VTVPYAACTQLYPPEGEHLRLETHRGECQFRQTDPKELGAGRETGKPPVFSVVYLPK